MRARASLTTGKTNINVSLDILAYKEDEIYAIYSPALDLFGYGETEEKAQESFKITLEEFLVYTTHNKTLFAEIKRQ